MIFPRKPSQIQQFFGFLRKRKGFGKYHMVAPGYVSEGRRSVPPHILKPSYYHSGEPPPSELIVPEVKDSAAVLGMRRSCRLARNILDTLGTELQVGRTTEELDTIAHKLIVESNAYPSPLNYRGFPKSICTSVNNVCCHGIPDDRPLLNGDIINIDVTVYFEGYHGDCSKTYTVGNVDAAGKHLIEITERCLKEAISVCCPGASFCEIGNVVENTAENHGLTVVPAFLGHGIGSFFHGLPEVYHIRNDVSFIMEPGNTFTIEPVLSQGNCDIEILEDGWTCVTVDGARTAQCEHTLLITEDGVDVLTEI